MINPDHTKMHLNVRAVKHILTSFQIIYGKKALDEFLDNTGITIDYFDDENNWVSIDYFTNLLVKLVEYSGDPEIPYKFGLNSATNMNWGIISTISTSFFSTAFAYKSVIALNPRWQKIGRVQFLELKKNKAIIESKLLNGFNQKKFNCLNTQGQLASVPTVFKLPPAKIKELQCAAEGADSCIYEIQWKEVPKRKTGLYLLLAGVALSVLLFLSNITKISIPYLSQWLATGVLVILTLLLYKRTDLKTKLNKSNEYKERLNTLLEENLVEIEKANEMIQEGVEKRRNEILERNKKIEQRIAYLRENEDDILQEEKMKILGHVAVDIASKLKAPVDKILNNVIESMKNGPDDPHYDYLDGSLTAIRRCEKIVNDLFTFTGEKDITRYVEIDINSIMKESIVKANDEKIDVDIKITTSFDENLPKIKGDSIQLEQVFINLMTNAYDSMIEKIKNKKAESGELMIKTRFGGGNIYIEFTDTGTGISDEMKGKIFDPFYTSKKTNKRKGLGLTICYNIITQHDGSIKAENIPGGARFLINLPVEKTTKKNN